MTCQERRDLLLLYVTGALEPAEAAELREHLLTGCPVCAGALAEAEAVVHRVPEGLSAVDVPDGAWGRIEKRVKLSGNPKMRLTDWLGWAAAAAIVVVAGIILESNYLSDTHTIAAMANENSGLKKDLIAALMDRDQARIDLASLKTEMNVRMAEFNAKLKKLADDNKAQLASVKTEMMNDVKHMVDADKYAIACAGMPGVKGTVFVDRKDGMCTLIASNLQALPEGKTYEMWMINDQGHKMAAGTFSMDKDGVAMHDYKIPEGMSEKGMVAVTDEPKGGAEQPTGNILFTATIQ